MKEYKVSKKMEDMPIDLNECPQINLIEEYTQLLNMNDGALKTNKLKLMLGNAQIANRLMDSVDIESMIGLAGNIQVNSEIFALYKIYEKSAHTCFFVYLVEVLQGAGVLKMIKLIKWWENQVRLSIECLEGQIGVCPEAFMATRVCKLTDVMALDESIYRSNNCLPLLKYLRCNSLFRQYGMKYEFLPNALMHALNTGAVEVADWLVETRICVGAKLALPLYYAKQPTLDWLTKNIGAIKGASSVDPRILSFDTLSAKNNLRVLNWLVDKENAAVAEMLEMTNKSLSCNVVILSWWARVYESGWFEATGRRFPLVIDECEGYSRGFWERKYKSGWFGGDRVLESIAGKSSIFD